MALDPELAQGRAFCFRCHKAARLCVCPTITSVRCDTPVHIVQHPRERHHPVGSLRFCELGLQGVQIHVATQVRDHEGEARMRSTFVAPPGAHLVFPSAGAQPIDSLARRPGALVFVDGTWSTVRALLRGDPALAALPRVRLAAVTPQRYRIRREPKPDYMSTLEAVVRALTELEPNQREALAGLLHAFDHMVDAQLEIAARSGPRARRRHARKDQARPRLPAAFREVVADLVVASVETTQVNRQDSPGTRARRQLVRITARRSAGGPVFDRWVRPAGDLPGPAALAHMGADVGALGSAAPVDEVRSAFQAFVAGAPALAAWNQIDLDLLPLEPPCPDTASPRLWVLKGLVAHATRARGGSLRDAHARAGLPPAPALAPGRNGRRLGAAICLVEWLCKHETADHLES